MRTLVIIFLLSIFNSCSNTSVDGKDAELPQKLLRHVVLFNFNDSATDLKIKEIEQAFSQLPEKISEIYSYEWGLNNSPEGLNKGMTHCFLVTFHSEEDRNNYLPHPSHQDFVKLIEGYIEDVTVVDYWTQLK